MLALPAILVIGLSLVTSRYPIQFGDGLDGPAFYAGPTGGLSMGGYSPPPAGIRLEHGLGSKVPGTAWRFTVDVYPVPAYEVAWR